MAIQSVAIDVQPHQHHAIQLIVPLAQACHLSIQGELIHHAGPMMIASQVPHQLASQQVIIILIEPESHLGQQIDRHYLPTQPFALLDHPPATLNLNIAEDFSWSAIEQYFASMGLSFCVDRHLDPRIQHLLQQLDQLLGQPHSPAINLTWALTIVHLSPSRFLHLFKQQMGIPWRPYLLWRRLISAIQIINAGTNITEAAIQCGFADSAHFSRTFKRMFGLAPGKTRLVN